MRLRLVPILWLVGCGCPRFDEMDFEDPDGLALTSDRADAFSAIADFARWTGEDGVCVPGVQVAEELSGGMAVGTYRGPRLNILQVPGAGYSTVVHELCHAIDQQNGWLSNDHPEVFPVSHVDPILYPHRAIQVQESFARVCEFGPQGVDLQTILEDQCGVRLEHPGQRLVFDEIYTEVSPARKPQEPGRIALEDVSVGALTGGGSLVDVASGARWIWLLTYGQPADVDGQHLDAAVDEYTWTVRAYDPDSWMLQATHHFQRDPAGDADFVSTFRLVDAVGEAPLLFESAGAAPARVWALNEDTGELDFLVDTTESLGAAPQSLLSVRQGDELVVYRSEARPLRERGTEAADNTVLPVGWVSVDLDSGDLTIDTPLIRALNEVLAAGAIDTLSATAQGVQLTTEGGIEGDYSASFQPTVQQWSGEDAAMQKLDHKAAMLGWWHGTLPGGEQVGVLLDGDYWNATRAVGGPVAYDPADRTWFVDDGVCAGSTPYLDPYRMMHVDDDGVMLMSTISGVLLVRVQLDR